MMFGGRFRLGGRRRAEAELEDFIARNGAMYIARDGRRVFAYESAARLVERFSPLIHRLMVLSGLTREEFARALTPVIGRFASLAGVLPASELNHDCDPGGLLRHSLHVALIALRLGAARRLYGPGDEYRQRGCTAALILLSLGHDLGKIVSDLEVTNLGGTERWRPLAEDLDAFCRRTGSFYIVLNFRDGRGARHKELSQLCLGRLAGPEDPLVELIARGPGPEALRMDEGGVLFKTVLEADGEAVGLTGSAGQSLINIPDFIRARIISDLMTGRLSVNTPEAEVFVCDWGLIIGCGSRYLAWMRDYYAKVITGCRSDGSPLNQGLSVTLRRRGVFAQFGTRRIYNWYRVSVGADHVYLRGALVSLPELRDFPRRVSAVMLGTRPAGLEGRLAALTGLKAEQVVSVRIRNGASRDAGLSGELDLSSVRCDDGCSEDSLDLEQACLEEQRSRGEEGGADVPPAPAREVAEGPVCLKISPAALNGIPAQRPPGTEAVKKPRRRIPRGAEPLLERHGYSSVCYAGVPHPFDGNSGAPSR